MTRFWGIRLMADRDLIVGPNGAVEPSLPGFAVYVREPDGSITVLPERYATVEDAMVSVEPWPTVAGVN